MYLVNRRVGFFRKRVQQQPAQSMISPISISSPMANAPVAPTPDDGKFMYFFIANTGVMYFDENWFKVRTAISESKSVEEIEQRMTNEAFRKLDLRRYTIASQINYHPFEDNFPFINRMCFEMVSITGKLTSLFIFALIDEPDLQDLYNFIHNLELSKKGMQDPPPLQAHHTSGIIQDKQSILKSNLSFFKRIVNTQENGNVVKNPNSIEKLAFVYVLDAKKNIDFLENNSSNNGSSEQENQIQQLSDDVTYSGQVKNNKPSGNGIEFRSSDGLQYKGNYRDGQKHGSGQFVDSNLEMYQYEYIMGRPVGI